MSNRALETLQSEITELEQILNSIPASDMIDRFTFEQRLAQARDRFQALVAPEKARESLRLTFRGAPVVASRGIFADFAGRASNAFADAFAAILAGLNSTLRSVGPIADRSRHPLLITGTAVGSFGFEIELPVDYNLFGENSRSDEAVELFKQLLRVSAEGTDDEIAAIIQEIHPRAVRTVATFLKVLQQNNAWCGIEFRNDFFKYSGLSQLEISEKRLGEENISETTETYVGEFQGVLPDSRNFEFRIADTVPILKGKVGKAISDPDILNRDWLHRPLTATFNVIQVGQGRPQFTLASLDNLAPS